MKIGKLDRPKPRVIPRGEPMILFKVGSYTLAMAEEEIRNTGGTTLLSVAGVRKVRHVLKRGQKTYYIVDAGTHLGVPLSRPTRLLLLREAIVGLSTGMLAEGPELIQILDLEKLASREVTA